MGGKERPVLMLCLSPLHLTLPYSKSFLSPVPYIDLGFVVQQDLTNLIPIPVHIAEELKAVWSLQFIPQHKNKLTPPPPPSQKLREKVRTA